MVVVVEVLLLSPATLKASAPEKAFSMVFGIEVALTPPLFVVMAKVSVVFFLLFPADCLIGWRKAISLNRRDGSFCSAP